MISNRLLSVKEPFQKGRIAMKDHMMMDEQKAKEIIVNKEDEDQKFREEQEKELEKQRERFEKAKLAKLAKKKAEPEEEPLQQDIEELLEEGREQVEQNMPEPLPEEIAQKQKEKVRSKEADDIDSRITKTLDADAFARKASKVIGNFYKNKRETASETMYRNIQGYKEQETDKEKLPNMARIRESHEAKYKTTVKKHILKPDEVIREKIVEDKDEKTARKKACMKLITREVNDVTDMKVKARYSVDIESKKKMDFQTFNTISGFGPLLGEDKLKDVVALYGLSTLEDRRFNDVKEKMEALKAQISQKKGAATKEEMDRLRELERQHGELAAKKELAKEQGSFPAMDMLTDSIMKIDLSAYDLSNDEQIARNAGELEKMSSAVKSYTELLNKNPEYFEKKMLQTTDKDKFGAKNVGGEILKKLDKLTAVANYYRLRKLVIEDDLYASLANEEITMEEEKDDSVKMKNLKKNLRLSYLAGVRMEEALGNHNMAVGQFDTVDKQAEIIRGSRMKTGFSASERDDDRANTMKLLYADEKDEITRRDVEEKYLREQQADGKSIMDRAFEHLNDFATQNKEIDRMEQERFFFAPNKQYSMTTIDPNKQRTTPAAGKYVGAVSNVGKVADTLYKNKYVEKTHKTELRDRYLEMGRKKTNSPSWGADPHFEGGKSEYLKELTLSDSWARMETAFSTSWAYKRTDDEMMEMYDLLSIQKDEEKWKEISKDPDKLAYYESAYKEMAMKAYSIAYATSVRTAQSVSMASLLLHPIDLFEQSSIEHRGITMGNVVPTNMLTPSNEPLIRKLFEENNKDGHILFDYDNFCDMHGFTGNINFKYLSFSGIYHGLSYEPSYEEDRPEIEYYSNQISYVEQILPEWEEFKKKNADNPEAINKITKYDESETTIVSIWYMGQHPELFDADHLKMKVDGDYLFGNSIHNGMASCLDQAEPVITKLIAEKKIAMPSEEEIAAYEKSLKERNMPPCRTQTAVNEHIKDMDRLISIRKDIIKESKDKLKKQLAAKDAKQEEIDKLNEDVKRKENDLIDLQDKKAALEKIKQNIAKDPYGIRLITSGFAEFKYISSIDGKERMLNSSAAY